jgi:hypothetical protein
MADPGIQEHLFQRIRERLPLNASLADVIAELLFVSNDSAYRRIRGETPLVLEEARILCQAFSLSLDELLQYKRNSISFNFTEADGAGNGFKKYLTDILGHLHRLKQANEKEIIYLTKDIPVFYNFLFGPLFSFRYFFWMKSILQHPDFLHRQFSSSCLPPEIEQVGKEIIKAYFAIPSIEVWNTECVNSTIAQVEYYREAGYFQSEEDIDKIYASLKQTIEHIRGQADHACKFLPEEHSGIKKNNFQFFFNRLVLGDNTIIVTADGRKAVFLSYDVLDFMNTQDEHFCTEMNNKVQSLIRRATILSNANEKQRNIFFNILLRKIPRRAAFINHNSL